MDLFDPNEKTPFASQRIIFPMYEAKYGRRSAIN
jgi:hypothetical protein